MLKSLFHGLKTIFSQSALSRARRLSTRPTSLIPLASTRPLKSAMPRAITTALPTLGPNPKNKNSSAKIVLSAGAASFGKGSRSA